MSKRVVISTFGSFGDINPYVALALGLKKRGHEPLVATAGVYRDYIEREGIGFHPVRPDVSLDDRDLIERVMNRWTGLEYLIRDLMFGSLRDTYRDLEEVAGGADLLVTHPLSFAGRILAEKRGIPWVSTVLAPMSFFSAYDPPVFAIFSFLEKLRSLGPAVNRVAVIQFSKLFMRKWSDPVYELRSELGLPKGLDPLFEGQHSPLLVFAMFSPLLGEPQPDWPENVEVTGFLMHDRGEGAGGLPMGLAEFLDAGPPPIVFTLGTAAVFTAGDFYRESVEAARFLGRRAVLLVGRDLAENVPDPLPEEVAAFPYAPYSELFSRAAAVVHSGGIGTTAHALSSGKPLLVVSFAYDQPDNAARAVRLGVALSVPARKYNANVAEVFLKELLSNPAYREKAQAVGAQVRSEDGIRVACDAMAKLLD